MSLDVYLSRDGKRLLSLNITHNVNRMAERAGIYMHLWRPDEMEPPITRASELIGPLTSGLRKLYADGASAYADLAPSNGWGSYDGLVAFVREYRDACERYPDADVDVSR